MKPIILDESTKTELITKFTDFLNTNKRLTDTKINFSADLVLHPANDGTPKPTIYITELAYLKMMLYVRDTSTEIAWHGIVNRLDDYNYIISDVMLYPQTLASATVTTDQEKYQDWLNELDDETFNHLRFQGHSHVNFGVSPSGTDLDYYNDILQTLGPNDYYIFMILNKAGNETFLLYDLKTNTIYDTSDINIVLLNNANELILDQIKLEKDAYCEKPVYTPKTTRLTSLKNDDHLENYNYLDYDDYYDNYDLLGKKTSHKTYLSAFNYPTSTKTTKKKSKKDK